MWWTWKRDSGDCDREDRKKVFEMRRRCMGSSRKLVRGERESDSAWNGPHVGDSGLLTPYPNDGWCMVNDSTGDDSLDVVGVVVVVTMADIV